jgi:hypothetical protein
VSGILRFTVPLPSKLPTLNRRISWQQRAREVRKLRALAEMAAIRARVQMPPRGDLSRVALQQRHVTLTLLRGPRQPLMDLSSWVEGAKGVVDGLSDAGLIVDDSPQWATFDYRQEIDRERGPAVVIEVRLAEQQEAAC